MKLKDIYIRDPYILLWDDVYYMYGKEYLEQKGFVVYTSNDLIEWSQPKQVFSPDENFWADREFWAPEVHEYNGKFYMFASFKAENRCRATQILVSDAPDQQFVPLTDNPITPPEWECLDGTLYVDKKGKPHIVFCHEWKQIGDGTMCEMELSEDLKSAKSQPRVIWKASDHKEVVDAIKGKESKVTDGPYLYRCKNGELICIWSSFNKNGYMEVVSRSDNGDIDGNWSIDSNPIIDGDGGHGMIFKSKDDETIFVMHSPNTEGLERARLYKFIEKDNTIVLEKYCG